MVQHRNTQGHVRMVAEFVASQAGPTPRSKVISKLNLSEANSTVYRWLSEACNQGLIERQGNLKTTAYVGTPALRAEIMRRTIRTDVAKRPRVGYVPEFLASYDQKKNPYLGQKDLQRLMLRCPPGSMKLGDFTDHEISMFMNDLSFSSSRLDGNQYDLAGTIALLEHDIANANLPVRDKIQIINHREASRYLINGVREETAAAPFQLSGHTIRGLHALLSADLIGDQLLCGTLRTKQVGIKFSSYVPLAIPAQIETEFNLMVRKARQIRNPYEQAFFLLVHLPYIQPFMDCNKRTARVACNLPLLKGSITPLSWLDTDQRAYTEACLAIYEHNDPSLMAEVFVDSFMRASERFEEMQRQREPDPISAMFRPEIKETIRARILDDMERISPNVGPDNMVDFLAYVDMELNLMAQNNMLGVRYGLTPGAVESWAVQHMAIHANARQRERERG